MTKSQFPTCKIFEIVIIFCLGRVLLFTSGQENAHYVEKVISGERYAITISFTCDYREAIPDPLSKF